MVVVLEVVVVGALLVVVVRCSGSTSAGCMDHCELAACSRMACANCS